MGLRRWLRGRDLAVAYATVVLVVALYVHTRPDDVTDRLVLNASTNLANLHDHPIRALFESAVVVERPAGLWILAPLVIAYGEAQRWLGRAPTVVAAAFGHVGGSLLVGVLLSAGIYHGDLDRMVARTPDVGVSYGLAAITGLLTARVPDGSRSLYIAALLAFWVGPLLVRPSFTGIGHATALTTGFGLAVVAARSRRADGRS